MSEEKLVQLVKAAVREELAARKKSKKAAFQPFRTFTTSEGVELEISVATDKGGQPILGFVKRAVNEEGKEVKKLGQWGFRLTHDVAAGLMELILEKYPYINQPTKARKRGRGA
jgi:hypothetical protein